MFRKAANKVLGVTLCCLGAFVLAGAGCPPTGAGTGGTPGTFTRPPGIYVGLQSNAIAVFGLDATGNVAPQRTIKGPNTRLNLPLGIGMDTQNNLYVANRISGEVTVYPSDADGDVAPTRILTAAGMGSPSGLVIGPKDDVFVSTCPSCGTANGGQNGVFHFNTNATTSDYVIGGATNNNTGFTVPGTIALDNSNPSLGPSVIVGNSFGGIIEAFGPGIQGDQFPTRSFSPGAAVNLQGITVGGNALFVTIPSIGVYVYLATASGDVQPTATLPFTAPFDVHYPGGLAIDASVSPPVGYQADYTGNAIFIVKTAGVSPALTVDSVTMIKGAATGLDRPLGVLVVKD
jgi:hypothetical protein